MTIYSLSLKSFQTQTTYNKTTAKFFPWPFAAWHNLHYNLPKHWRIRILLSLTAFGHRELPWTLPPFLYIFLRKSGNFLRPVQSLSPRQQFDFGLPAMSDKHILFLK